MALGRGQIQKGWVASRSPGALSLRSRVHNLWLRWLWAQGWPPLLLSGWPGTCCSTQSAMSLRRDSHPGEVRARCLAGAHKPEVPWLTKVTSQWSGRSRGIPSCLHAEPPNQVEGTSSHPLKSLHPSQNMETGEGGSGPPGGQQLRLQLSLPRPLTARAPRGQRLCPLTRPRAPMSGNAATVKVNAAARAPGRPLTPAASPAHGHKRNHTPGSEKANKPKSRTDKSQIFKYRGLKNDVCHEDRPPFPLQIQGTLPDYSEAASLALWHHPPPLSCPLWLWQ